jgi:predicted Zn-dependent protease
MKQTAPLILALSLAVVPIMHGRDQKRDPDAIGDRNVDKGVNFYSVQKELALGKAMAEDLEKDVHIMPGASLAEYVNRIGQNLVRNSDVKIPVVFKIIEDPQINAITLPGGHIFVNTGLILLADSEAELAGALAHEIAHAAARHGTRQASRQQLADIATIPLIFMGGWIGYGTRQAASLGGPMGMLAFDRGFEEEADLLGIQYLYKAGYDPVAMVSMFERMNSQERKKPGAIAKLFATHPATGGRIVKTQKNIEELLAARPEYVVTTSEFEERKTDLARALAPSPKNDVSPAALKPTLRRRMQSTLR